MFGCYALSDHVLSDAVALHVPAWCRMDCVALSWLFNSITPDLMETVQERGSITARFAWLGIEEQFLGIRETCALHLDVKFRNFIQGDLSVGEFSPHEGHG